MVNLGRPLLVHRADSDPAEPPFELGDGLDPWPFLSGRGNIATHGGTPQAHAHGSTDGNGNSLRVGDWKTVIHAGAQWSTGSHFGSNDGWYGGPQSADVKGGSYALSTGKLTMGCSVPPPPRNVTAGFACEARKELMRPSTCLFNIAKRPGEFIFCVFACHGVCDGLGLFACSVSM